MTPEEHKRAHYQGKAFVIAALASLVRGGSLPLEGCESYVAGMAEGIREFVTAHVSERAAYDLLQNAADRVAAHRVQPAPEGQS